MIKNPAIKIRSLQELRFDVNSSRTRVIACVLRMMGNNRLRILVMQIMLAGIPLEMRGNRITSCVKVGLPLVRFDLLVKLNRGTFLSKYYIAVVRHVSCQISGQK